VVPDKGYDAVLFGAMAVVVAVLLQGKYSALWTLVAGASPSATMYKRADTCGAETHHQQRCCDTMQVGPFNVWPSYGTQAH